MNDKNIVVGKPYHKRMFDVRLVDSDRFLDMPQGSRYLYYTLGMIADDNGYFENIDYILKKHKVDYTFFEILEHNNYIHCVAKNIYMIDDWTVNNNLSLARLKNRSVTSRSNGLCYVWRKAVLDRDENTCQECGATNTTLHAHHIKGWKHNPKLRLEIKNGITLCLKCHKQIHPWM